MPLLDRLGNIGDADISKRFYDKVGCVCEFMSITERDVNTTPPKTVVTVAWKTTAPLTTRDGANTLAPGNTLKQDIWVDPADPEDVDGLKADLKRISVALNRLPVKATDCPPVTDADAGKQAYVYLTYSPNKKNPDGDGFQNFRVSAVKA